MASSGGRARVPFGLRVRVILYRRTTPWGQRGSEVIRKFSAGYLTGFISLFLAAAPLCAQQAVRRESGRSASASADADADGFLFAIVGGPGKSTHTPFNTTRRPSVLELEVSKTLRRSSGKKVNYEYFVASQPLVDLGGNLRFTWTRYCGDPMCRRYADVVSQRNYNAYGFGITPLGMRANFALPHAARFSLAFSAGGVYLSKAVPADEGTHFNFQFSLRPAVTIPVSGLGKLWAGYELFHVSNGYTGKINPGINAGLMMIGFQRARW